MSPLNRVYIYTDLPSPSLSVEDVRDYLVSLGIATEVRGGFFGLLGLDSTSAEALASTLASTVVDDIERSLDELVVGGGAAAEERVAREVSYISGGAASYPSSPRVLYDGNWLQRIFHTRLAAATEPGELYGPDVHLIFTGRLFVTYEGRRYHARVVLAGGGAAAPGMISTSGLVEGPARPREYYMAKAALLRSGRDASELDEIFKGRYLNYDDPLVTPAMKSYALQAIFSQAIGAEFCTVPTCPLFNSHWQEEVIRAQVEGRLCGGCELKLRKMLEG